MNGNRKEKQINVKMKPEDYVIVRWYVNRQTKHITAAISPMIPPTGISTTMKGQIGELIAHVLMNSNFGGVEGLIELQQAGYEFDILDQRTGLRYDVKFSPLKTDKGPNAAYWKFHFATNKARNDAQQISETKYLKDYTQTCDAFIFIGLRNTPDKPFEIYIISSLSPLVLGKRNISIPASGKGKFAEYKVDPETLIYLFSGAESIETEVN